VRRLGVPLWKLPRISRRVRALKAASADRVPLFGGVGDLLRRLADGGVALAVVSSDAESNVRRGLGPESAALIGHYGCGAALFGKAAKLRGVLKTSGVPAARAILIGDEVRDAEAARAAGVAFGAVSWGYAMPEALRAQAPAELFASVDEIARKLLA
jgi:phosphoglycolate phosphatase